MGVKTKLLMAALLGLLAASWASAQPGAASAAAAGAVLAQGDNPYGLQALWRQGDAVAKITLMLLLLMSVGSWWVMVNKFIEQTRCARHARAAQTLFWRADSLAQALAALAADSPFRALAQAAEQAVAPMPGLARGVAQTARLGLAIGRAVTAQHQRLQGGLSWLATVGATAPFVGLFGTVWGIYNALVQIGISGQASIDRVAGPVGEALIMTALGLAVAVPAVLGYNALMRRNRVLLDQINGFADELQVLIPTLPEAS